MRLRQSLQAPSVSVFDTTFLLNLEFTVWTQIPNKTAINIPYILPIIIWKRRKWERKIIRIMETILTHFLAF